jgi:hypothetical protein
MTSQDIVNDRGAWTLKPFIVTKTLKPLFHILCGNIKLLNYMEHKRRQVMKFAESPIKNIQKNIREVQKC